MPEATVPQIFDRALELHQGGRLSEAEQLFRQVLAAQPDHAGALQHLGLIAFQVGRYDIASGLIRRSVALDPDCFEGHYHLAMACAASGQLGEAITSYRRALELRPDDAETHNDLAVALARNGQLEEAVDEFRRATECDPGNAAGWNNLGNALNEQGRREEALAAFRRALELRPALPTAHYNVGNALQKQGRLEEAAEHYQRAIELTPNHPDFHNNLANVLREQGRTQEAIGAFQRAVQLKPDHVAAWYNLGNALGDLGQMSAAVDAYERAVQAAPRDVMARYNLGIALAELNKLDEAEAAYRRVVQLQPDHALAFNNLGNALREKGQQEKAMAAYQHASQLEPGNASLRSNVAYTQHFLPGLQDDAMPAEHERWHRQFAEPLHRYHRPHGNTRDPIRRLRVGYVSPNFSRHVISHFFTPLLEAHDKTEVEVCCYASVKWPDHITERMKNSADAWHDVVKLSDHELAERIREDRINILVDLNLHMANSRLLTFAEKPAPVQVSWLGYPASTGLPEIDYRFTDALLEPEGAPWSRSPETPLRLPETWCCFDPIDDYPQPAPPPATGSGRVTFGCLNNFTKINGAVLCLWADLLRADDRFQLLIQCPAGESQARLRRWFESEGIAADRLRLVWKTATREEFLRTFSQIDIALDPFPYNGGTTTFEALWMGIPVVSLAGTRAVARVGLSALTNVGLPELATATEADYIAAASRLAHDMPRLEELRRTLRSRMQASPLMDAKRFAKGVEVAYRAMWQEWCAAI